MHLVSTERQTIRFEHTEVRFDAGETIHTENSYKYDLDQSRELLAGAGWRRVTCWTDPKSYFSVQYCECENADSTPPD